MTFPGAYKLWLRNIENAFCVSSCSLVAIQVEEMEDLIQVLIEREEIDKGELKDVIESIQKFKRLCRIRNTDYSNIHKLQELLQLTKLSINDHNTCLWDLDPESLYESDQSNRIDSYFLVKFEDAPGNHQARKLISLCETIRKDLKAYYTAKGLSKFFRMFRYKPFGRIDQMRNELEIRYNGIQTWCKTFDGKKIDCMLIPASPDSNSTVTDYKNCPTMLFCNPNAGYYEYLTYQTEWLSYISLGINVAIWNYRGYGRSEGSPNPKNIRKDGEYVLKHFKEHFYLTNKFGIHGQSLGGSVASYVARHTKVDFLFVDRSFEAISKVPESKIGKIARYFYLGVTCFGDSVAPDYVAANCYKVVSCDPDDQLLDEPCSLSNAISRETVNEAHRFSGKDFNFSKYFHIISKDEGDILFKTIKELLKLGKKLYSWKKYEDQLEELKELSTNQDDSNNQFNAIVGIGNSSLHEGAKNQYGEDSLTFQVHSGFNSKNMNRTVFVDRPNLEEPAPKSQSSEYLETCQDEDCPDDFLKITIPGVEEEPSPSQIYDEYKNSIKYLEKKEKKYFEKSDYRTLSKLLAKIIRILEKIDAKGISLIDVFKYSSWNQEKQFKTFFINLDIWGAWESYNNQEIEDLSVHLRKQASEKIEFAKISLLRCISLMKNEKGKLFEFVRFGTNILHNSFEKISDYLKARTTVKSKKLEEEEKTDKYLQSPMKNADLMKITEQYEPGTGQTENDKFESIRLDEPCKIDDSQVTEEYKLENDKNEYMKFTTPNAENSFKDEPIFKNRERSGSHSLFNSLTLSDKAGHLMLVKCGHNGYFSFEEKSLYEKYLKHSKFI